MGKSLEQVIAEHWETSLNEKDEWACICGHPLTGSASTDLQRHLRNKIYMWIMAAITDPGIVDDYRKASDTSALTHDDSWAHPADAAVSEFLAWMVSEEREINGPAI